MILSICIPYHLSNFFLLF
ncbi:hypothetical protein [Bacillus nitroreducens]